ncbi:phage tail protein [Acuticoccus sp. M5D2P5]|nr:phage tail protein [Acuticoccus kalidii]
MHGIDRRTSPRIGRVKIQGSRPSMHHSGSEAQEVRIEATLYPRFLGGRGLDQVDGMRRDAEAGEVFTLASISGEVWGRFLIEDIYEKMRYFDAAGVAQRVEVDIKLLSDGPMFSGAGLGISQTIPQVGLTGAYQLFQ